MYPDKDTEFVSDYSGSREVIVSDSTAQATSSVLAEAVMGELIAAGPLADDFPDMIGSDASE